ncbi:pimeloyl-ACP methyl ester esterase BioH [Glaciecola sp. XM2]|jgi:pimeloyl-[acyl-carrier protein] methyl ester esterase|uniref:pimeloyl-ACP methyl ester esterase BioH n=1 Tax=Glaciecola sp. XM2 TaxID=1914931 RepID=UPI001BDDE3BA|nr:pimeloyl-ACP methyl ester esterase BioH [Glaciecola sp. XM2]MBT1451437.1 pimeloyl-ACP methyl ester esterase BioH [Glaciecola sp. XM2]
MSQHKQLNHGTDLNLTFLHGWGMNHRIFTHFTQRLESQLHDHGYTGIRINSLDLPGYGTLHSAPASDMTLTDMADYLTPLLAENTVLLGWSLGGLVAQQIALGHSNKLKGLITLCSTPKFASRHLWKGIEPDVLNSFVKQLQNDREKTIKRFLTIQNLGQASAKTDVQQMLQILSDMPAPSAATLQQGLAILASEDLRERVAQIDVPTLRVYGRLDALVPHQSIAAIEALHPNAKSIVYPKASHAPFMSHPDLLSQDLMRFIADVKKT